MYYFISDTHLGQGADTRQREDRLIARLNKMAEDAKGIFLMGDILDFWYEYKRVVPKGFTRLFCTLARLAERGIEVHYFVGNHDMWIYDYLKEECGVTMHYKGEVMELYGKKLYLAHGDFEPAIRPWLVNFMNNGFRSKFVRWVFSTLIHPDLGMKLGQAWSTHSRNKKSFGHRFYGEDEPLMKIARQKTEVDFCIFGHIHCAEDIDLGDERKVIFLGHWFTGEPYATLNKNGDLKLCNNI